ncbi:hypothetical protein K432DRAFT_282548, partial [Lepidopterella palustris CBS 459.81]
DYLRACAEDRNFWDGYNALRPINVDAGKALAHVSTVLISRRLGYRPDFTNLSGKIDVTRLQEIAAAIAQSVTSRNGSNKATMTVIDYPGSAQILIEGLASHTIALLQRDENRSVAELPTKSAL